MLNGETLLEQHEMTREIIDDKFPTPNKFSLMIESLSAEHGLSYVETIVQYCQTNDIDYDSVSKMISPTLKGKLEQEYMKLNMIKRTSNGKLKKK